MMFSVLLTHPQHEIVAYRASREVAFSSSSPDSIEIDFYSPKGSALFELSYLVCNSLKYLFISLGVVLAVAFAMLSCRY